MAPKYLQILLFIFAFFLVGIAPAEAHHSWKGHHWERNANPVVLTLANNVPASWKNILRVVANDWNTSSVVHLTVVIDEKDPKKCRPTFGRIDVCVASYGKTGWLGTAHVWVLDNHIMQATLKLNDTYFKRRRNNTNAWKSLVMCQEIGHAIGLDHQDEVKKNANLGTCMDYTKDPSGVIFKQLNNERPNSHDYEELETIYAHLDVDAMTLFGIAIPLSVENTLDMNNSQEWGTAVRVSYNGKSSIHERGFGKDGKVFTFVVWTD